jgi:dihydrofolate reductase
LSRVLVDEYHFWVFPVTAGSGEHLFEGVGTALELLDATTFKSGIVVGRYAPT